MLFRSEGEGEGELAPRCRVLFLIFDVAPDSAATSDAPLKQPDRTDGRSFYRIKKYFLRTRARRLKRYTSCALVRVTVKLSVHFVFIGRERVRNI